MYGDAIYFAHVIYINWIFFFSSLGHSAVASALELHLTRFNNVDEFLCSASWLKFCRIFFSFLLSSFEHRAFGCDFLNICLSFCLFAPLFHCFQKHNRNKILFTRAPMENVDTKNHTYARIWPLHYPYVYFSVSTFIILYSYFLGLRFFLHFCTLLPLVVCQIKIFIKIALHFLGMVVFFVAVVSAARCVCAYFFPSFFSLLYFTFVFVFCHSQSR